MNPGRFSSPSKKMQLIQRIVEVSKCLGSDVTEIFYLDYEVETLENELELLEEQLMEEREQ